MTNEIIQIQEMLRIPATGTFDEFTEAALRNFQLKNNLPVSGVIDNETKKALLPENSMISTDLRETAHLIKSKLLNKDEYRIDPAKNKWIFLHHTAGWENPYATVNDWETDKRGQVATQFIIGGRNCQTLESKYDGEIVQTMPNYNCYGWHLGIGNTNVHRNSVGIELCNFGFLQVDGKVFRTYDSLDSTGRLIKKGAIVNPEEIIDLKRDFRGYRYYHKYSENQVLALKYLIQKIGKETGIDVTQGLKQKLLKTKDPFTAFDYDVDVVSGKIEGLFCHTNVSPKNRWGGWEKWDLSPQPLIIEMILSL